MASLDEISQAIGSLQANVTFLTVQVAPIADLKADVSDIKDDMAAMRPVVKKVERWEQRIIGISAVVSAIITIVGTGLLAKIKGWFA